MIFSQKNMHAKNFACQGPQVPSLSKRIQITNIFVKRKKNKKILDNIF